MVKVRCIPPSFYSHTMSLVMGNVMVKCLWLCQRANTKPTSAKRAGMLLEAVFHIGEIVLRKPLCLLQSLKSLPTRRGEQPPKHEVGKVVFFKVFALYSIAAGWTSQRCLGGISLGT